jgi:NADH-quinone oxidoreductase subunit J
VGLTIVLGGLFAGALIRAVTLLPARVASPPPPAPGFGSTEEVGRLLFGPYLYPFELAGILLLVAMVGSVVLARREE